MSKKHLETHEIQRRHVVMTYLVGNCCDAGLPCFLFYDERGGSVRCWMVVLTISCWCNLSPLRWRRPWRVRCELSLLKWRRRPTSWRRLQRARGAVEREKDMQPEGAIGEGSRRVATLSHGGDAGRWAPGRRGERRGSAAERGHLSCGDFSRRIETIDYG
jgi:hypothetical protein